MTSPWEHPPLHDCAACSRKRETALQAEVERLTREEAIAQKVKEAALNTLEAVQARLAAQEARAQRVEAALRLLWHEVQESGNAMAGNDGWPKAIAATRAALSQPAAPTEDSQRSPNRSTGEHHERESDDERPR
jgi:hypothetical protein